MRIEVVACREVESPVLRRLHIARKAQVLGNLSFILHLLLVEVAIAIVHRVVHREAPREIPLCVAVFIEHHAILSAILRAAAAWFIFIIIVLISGYVAVGVLRGLLVLVVIFLLALESGVIECVGERCSGARQLGESLAGLQSGAVHSHRRARWT